MMDVRLREGDMSITASGGTEYIGGLSEAVQRVALAASVPKGSFRYDRSFGTDYSSLTANDPMLKEKLDMRVKEATADIGGVEVKVLSVDIEHVTARLSVTYCGASETTEVDLNGYI